LRKKVEKLNWKIETMKRSRVVKTGKRRKRLSSKKKLALLARIENLSPLYYRGALEMLRAHRTYSDDYQASITRLPSKAIKELDRYVRRCTKLSKLEGSKQPSGLDNDSTTPQTNTLSPDHRVYGFSDPEPEPGDICVSTPYQS
jgi:hypothetical protein